MSVVSDYFDFVLSSRTRVDEDLEITGLQSMLPAPDGYI